MTEYSKARKFLPIIALFSCIAVQVQPLQAGRWGSIISLFSKKQRDNKDIESSRESFERKTEPSADEAILEDANKNEFKEVFDEIEKIIAKTDDQTQKPDNDISQRDNNAFYEDIQCCVKSFVTSSQKLLESTQSIQAATTTNNRYSQLTDERLRAQLLGDSSGPKRLDQLIRSVLLYEQQKRLSDLIEPVIERIKNTTATSQLIYVAQSWDKTVSEILDTMHKYGIYTNYHPDLKHVVGQCTAALELFEKKRFRYYKREAQRSPYTKSIGEESICKLFEQPQSNSHKSRKRFVSHEQSIPELLSAIHTSMNVMVHRINTGIITGNTPAKVLSILKNEMQKIEHGFSKECGSQTYPPVRDLLDSVEKHDMVTIEHDGFGSLVIKG